MSGPVSSTLRPAFGTARAAARPGFPEAVRAETPFVLRVVRRLGVPSEDVDDVAQEVFLVLHRRYLDWDPASPLRSYLFGIVRRSVANHRRKIRNRRVLPFHDELGLPDSARDPLGSLEQSDARALLEAALSALDADKREVFVLFELEQLEMAEVAALVGCSLKTAYSRLYAARVIVKRTVLRLSARRPVR